MPTRTGPSPTTVRATLYGTAIVLASAALVHLIRYALLMINRTTLLNPAVAGAALWLGVITSLAAIAVVIACAVVMTRWLTARRAAVFAHLRGPETRSTRALWAGCLVPLVNLAWAPVYVVEMATAEENYSRLRKPIIVWWILWVLSTVVSIFAIATSFATDAQGIANNTVTMTFAYVLALAAVVAIARVFFGFDRKPVERPAHRWVIVATTDPVEPATPDSGVAVEPQGQEPAA